MKKFLLIVPFLVGCAVPRIVTKTVEVVKPCITQPAPDLAGNKLEIAVTKEIDEQLVGFVFSKVSFARFSKWVTDTLAWEKNVQEKCTVK